MQEKKEKKDRERDKKRREDRERRSRREVEKREFKKTRRFIGDRIRMCRLTRVGRRQRFERAGSVIKRDIAVMYMERKREEMKETQSKLKSKEWRMVPKMWGIFCSRHKEKLEETQAREGLLKRRREEQRTSYRGRS